MSSNANGNNFAKPQPLNHVEWIDRDLIEPNDYNPNRQPPPENRLLKISILEDGWTQPIVIAPNGGKKFVIVDGEHRWHLSADKEVRAMTNGLVPVVRLEVDAEHRMFSTVRHNRARGNHAVLPMADIVQKLLTVVPPEDVAFLLQMEDEEVERLAERAGLPSVVSNKNGQEFNKGWVPKNAKPIRP